MLRKKKKKYKKPRSRTGEKSIAYLHERNSDCDCQQGVYSHLMLNTTVGKKSWKKKESHRTTRKIIKTDRARLFRTVPGSIV